MGVELAARAEVDTLAIFHHDPGASDGEMEEFLGHTKKFLERSPLQFEKLGLEFQELLHLVLILRRSSWHMMV